MFHNIPFSQPRKKIKNHSPRSFWIEFHFSILFHMFLSTFGCYEPNPLGDIGRDSIWGWLRRGGGIIAMLQIREVVDHRCIRGPWDGSLGSETTPADKNAKIIGKSHIITYYHILSLMDQGSDKGGVVQRILIGIQDTKHKVRNYKIRCMLPFL
jgi:hypothetical protein